MACSDPLLLQRFFDNEVDVPQTDVVAFHLETCDACRAEAARITSLRAFVQEQLGAEDEGEEEATAQTVAAISSRIVEHGPARPGFVRRWRSAWLATAALIVLALLIPSFLATLVASPGEILENAAERARMWMYQPGKNLHWQVDTVSHGIKGVRDGRWRTYFWRSNRTSSFAEISRQIDPAGRLEFVYWRRHDGSSLSYSAKNGNIEVAPPTQSLREALPSLDPTLREGLQSHLTARALNQSLDVQRRRDLDRVHGRSIWVADGKATFRQGFLDRLGKTQRITVTKEMPVPLALRAVHEYDIDSETRRLLRLRTTIAYLDGTTGVHDSRWVLFREIGASEFTAQQPAEMLDRGIQVIHLTPRDLALRMSANTNRSPKTE